MLVYIDKVTCARMLPRTEPRWQARQDVRERIRRGESALAATTTSDAREQLNYEYVWQRSANGDFATAA